MVNLSDITGQYIDIAFIPQQKALLLNGFAILENFNLELGFYEDKYVNLISSDFIDSDSKTLSFFAYMEEDLKLVIGRHGIKTSKDHSPTLAELIEICHALLLLANLEDYSEVGYRVHSDGFPRLIFIDLLERFSLLSRFRAMEIIESVDKGLIETLRGLSEGAMREGQPVIDLKHKHYVDAFFAFTEQASCLGLTCREQGYSGGLTFEELLNLLPYSVVSYVETNHTLSLEQVAYDVLSLLVITRDDYSLPLFKLKKNSGLISADLEIVTRIHNTIFKMVDDFSLYLQAKEQGDKVNGNQA